MALTERTIYGHIGILEDGQLQLREDTIIERDGIEISRVYHRRVLAPGDDVTPYPERLKTISAVIWTPIVVAAYQDAARQRERAIK